MRRFVLASLVVALVMLAVTGSAVAFFGRQLVVGGCVIQADSRCPGTSLPRAYLSGMDLHGADLSGSNLEEAHLDGANLAGANLAGSNLRGVDLTQANLSGANLSATNMAKANLFAANLRGARLTHANLTGASIRGAGTALVNLDNADLAGADLSRSTIVLVNAHHTNFRAAIMNGVTMSFVFAYSAIFEGGQMSDADLRGLVTPSGDFKLAKLTHSDLSGAFFEKVNLEHADLGGTKLHSTNLVGANLRNANLVGANFSDTRLHGAITERAIVAPSNIATDMAALLAFYEKVQGNINGTICNEQKPREVAWVCFGASASGGTHGFNGSAKASFRFDEQGELGGPTIEVSGSDDVRLHGPASANFGAFWPESVRGLEVFGLARNAGVAAGEPGGPLAVGIEKYSHWVNVSLQRGYRFKMHGWLRRR
jgi:uncharacterized protein YjbI with pentapeptide repeats